MRLPVLARSLRVRLAVVFTVLVASIIALVGVVTYQLLRQSLLDELERDLTRRAETFQAVSPAPPYDLNMIGDPDVLLQVVSADGVALARTGNLGSGILPLPDPARDGAVVKVHMADRPLFLTAAPLDAGRYVVVARSPATIYGTLRTLRTLLTAVVALAMTLTCAASWLYARAALKPIERVVDAAGAVRDSRDLARRVPHQAAPDELGRLVEAFNDMLAELDDAYTSLDRSNQQMRQFLADCSHELRCPLARIRSTVDVLERVDGAEAPDDVAFRSQALADIAAETDRMARMVRQLLILARADVGASIEPRPVRLGRVLGAACRQAERMTTGIALVAPSPDALGDTVISGDADHLEQVLLILLDNAFKYTPPPGEVRVEAVREGNDARISVSDTGLGVPPEDADRIFERFYRGRNSTVATGTGLGLAIASWVIEQHHGRIEYARADNGGSRFSIVLPVTHHR